MKINPVSNWSPNFAVHENSQADYSKTFSKVVENLKRGRPVDYDEEAMKGQKTQTMTQILSDGSTLITVFDENGKVISQSKTAAVRPDSSPQVIATRTENNFGLGELSNFNFVLQQ